MEAPLKVDSTNYRVSDFLSWQRKGNLDLRPPFQRGSVWSAKAKSFFIDSILRGFPVPLIFLQERTDPKTYEPKRLVVDGQQRLRTVLAYVDPLCLDDKADDDSFVISKIHNKGLAGATFVDLEEDLQQRILSFRFSVHILPATTSDSLILQTFARMNATGVRLNDQEMRNARFSGAFKHFVYEMAFEQIDRWVEWRVFSKSQIARMAEAQLTSELVMFMIDGLSGRSQKKIDDYYSKYDDEVPFEDSVRNRFARVLDGLDDLYSEDLNELYKEPFDKSPFNTQSWFYPLYVFLYEQSYRKKLKEEPKEKPRPLSSSTLRQHLQARARDLRAQDFDTELLKALRGASTDEKSRRARLEFLRKGWAGAGRRS